MLLDAREYERFEHPPADGGKLCIFGHEATVTQYSSCTQSYSFIGRFRPWLPAEPAQSQPRPTDCGGARSLPDPDTSTKPSPREATE
jgi:hypothetical protein